MAKTKKFKSESWYKFLTPLMRLLFKIVYRPKIVNGNAIPNEGAIIIVSNHKHVYDQCFAICATKRPIHYLAKKEYFDSKNAWMFKLVGCIPVNREAHDGKAKNKAIKILENNGAVGLFPEGTRNKTKDQLLLPFKYGAVSMAQKTGALIIPSAITGDYKIFNKNLIARFGEPISIPKDMSLEVANDLLTKEIEKLIEENLNETKRSLEEEIDSHMEAKQ